MKSTYVLNVRRFIGQNLKNPMINILRSEKMTTYEEKMAKITKILEDALKEKGFVLQVIWIAYATIPGYDANIYLCEKERYEAEFGEVE